MAGCRASGWAPASTTGASTPSPCAPDVCATTCPGEIEPVSTRPATSPASVSSGTARIRRWTPAGTWSTGTSLVPGSNRSIRDRLLSDTPDAATTLWPALARAAPSTAPTRPTPIMPMVRVRGSRTERVDAERVEAAGADAARDAAARDAAARGPAGVGELALMC